MGLYLGNKIITPSIVSQGSSGSTIIAANTTGSAISSGDKVYIQHTYDGWNILELTPWIRNFGINGTVTIDDTTGIASVTSTGRHVQIDLEIDYMKPWEFKTKVDYTSYGYNSFLICGKAASSSMLTQAGFSLFICGNNSVNGEAVNTLQMIYLQNGTATQIGTAKNSIAENSTNYLKCGWDGKKFYVSCSTDGSNWSTRTASSTTPTTYADIRHYILGTSWTAQSYLHGSMYLKETYIYSNGAYLFSPYLMNLAPDYYIGFAQENIAIGSSGSVQTALPEEVTPIPPTTLTCVINFEDASNPDTDLSGEHIFIEFQEADETVISYTETVAGEPFSIPAGTYYLVLHTDNVYIIDQEVLTITELEAENYNITIPVMV